MSEDQKTASTESNQPPQAGGDIAGAVLRRRQRAQRLLSPWLQSRLAGRRTGRSLSPVQHGGQATLTIGRTRRLLNKVYHTVDRARIWKPGVGLLQPVLVQRFSQAVVQRLRRVRPVSPKVQPSPPFSGRAEQVELVLPTGYAPAPGSGAGAGQVIPRMTTITQDIFSMQPGQRIEPMRSASLLPSQPAAQPKTTTRPDSQRLPPKSRLFTRVEEGAAPGKQPAGPKEPAQESEAQPLPGVPPLRPGRPLTAEPPRPVERRPSPPARPEPKPVPPPAPLIQRQEVEPEQPEEPALKPDRPTSLPGPDRGAVEETPRAPLTPPLVESRPEADQAGIARPEPRPAEPRRAIAPDQPPTQKAVLARSEQPPVEPGPTFQPAPARPEGEPEPPPRRPTVPAPAAAGEPKMVQRAEAPPAPPESETGLPLAGPPLRPAPPGPVVGEPKVAQRAEEPPPVQPGTDRPLAPPPPRQPAPRPPAGEPKVDQAMTPPPAPSEAETGLPLAAPASRPAPPGPVVGEPKVAQRAEEPPPVPPEAGIDRPRPRPTPPRAAPAEPAAGEPESGPPPTWTARPVQAKRPAVSPPASLPQPVEADMPLRQPARPLVDEPQPEPGRAAETVGQSQAEQVTLPPAPPVQTPAISPAAARPLAPAKRLAVVQRSPARFTLSRQLSPTRPKTVGRRPSLKPIKPRIRPGGLRQTRLLERRPGALPLLNQTPDLSIGPRAGLSLLKLDKSGQAAGRQRQETPADQPVDPVQSFLEAELNKLVRSMELTTLPRPAASPAPLSQPPPARPAQPAQPARTGSSRPAELTLPLKLAAQPAPAQNIVQRQPESPPVISPAPAASPPGTPAVVQRVVGPRDTASPLDLAELARQVYPLIKRLFAIERERRPIR